MMIVVLMILVLSIRHGVLCSIHIPLQLKSRGLPTLNVTLESIWFGIFANYTIPFALSFEQRNEAALFSRASPRIDLHTSNNGRLVMRDSWMNADHQT